MRFALLLLFASSCTTAAADHTVTGTYETNDPDGVIVDGSIESVVEIKVTDGTNTVIDDVFFHSESVSGPFTFTVPDGSTNVLVWFHSNATTGQGNQTEYEIDGPIESDVDMGFIGLF